MTRTVLISLLMLLLPTALWAQDGQQPLYQAGTHYEVLENAVRTRDPAKVEVVEVFWYGCSHCYHFEPMIKAWKQQAPAHVDFWQSPAMWSPVMEVHARAFYTAIALGVVDKVHDPLFAALNVERKLLNNEAALAELFTSAGVDRDAFTKAFNSFAVNSQVKQADARARSFKISGTPEMVVNGKYRITAKLAGGQSNMLKVADFLVAQEYTAMQKAAQ